MNVFTHVNVTEKGHPPCVHDYNMRSGSQDYRRRRTK